MQTLSKTIGLVQGSEASVNSMKQTFITLRLLKNTISAFCILLPCLAASAQGLQAADATATQTESIEREPAQEPIKMAKPVDAAPTPEAVAATPVRPAGGGRIPRVQFSLSGGAMYSSSDDIGGSYKHQTSESPIGRFGYHYAFFSTKPFNLLLGGDFVASRSVAKVSGATTSSTFQTDRIDLGVTIGLGWAPGGPGSAFQFQGFIGTGITPSRTQTLKSPGFTTNASRKYPELFSNLSAWINVVGVYSVTPNWRLMAGFCNLDSNNTSSVLAGVAYAY